MENHERKLIILKYDGSRLMMDHNIIMYIIHIYDYINLGRFIKSDCICIETDVLQVMKRVFKPKIKQIRNIYIIIIIILLLLILYYYFKM